MLFLPWSALSKRDCKETLSDHNLLRIQPHARLNISIHALAQVYQRLIEGVSFWDLPGANRENGVSF